MVMENIPLAWQVLAVSPSRVSAPAAGLSCWSSFASQLRECQDMAGSGKTQASFSKGSRDLAGGQEADSISLPSAHLCCREHWHLPGHRTPRLSVRRVCAPHGVWQDSVTQESQGLLVLAGRDLGCSWSILWACTPVLWCRGRVWGDAPCPSCWAGLHCRVFLMLCKG